MTDSGRAKAPWVFSSNDAVSSIDQTPEKRTDKTPMFSVDACSSTMDLARNLAESGRLPVWGSVLAATQLAGRGQFGRTWVSPRGNLYGSLRLPALSRPWNDLLPLLLAESLHAVLKDLGVASAVKWPNDLLVDGKKVAGVLTEARSGIILGGLGLNLISAPPDHVLRQPSAGRAGCLAASGVRLTPLEIWTPLVHRIRLHVAREVKQGDPGRFVRSLTPCLAFIGQPIRLDAYAAAGVPAIFQGLDPSGAIRVMTADGEQVFHSGSIYPVI